jgi:hypothetical protein
MNNKFLNQIKMILQKICLTTLILLVCLSMVSNQGLFYLENENCSSKSGPCKETKDCCKGFICSREGKCRGGMVEPELKDCKGPGSECQVINECCKHMHCIDGFCHLPSLRKECIKEDMPCKETHECCDNNLCLEGTCQHRC